MKKITFFLLSAFVICITSTAQVTVTLNVSPPDTEACDNEILTFTANITGCPGAYTIYWKDYFQFKDTCYSPCTQWVTTLSPGIRRIWCTVDCNPNGNGSSSEIFMNIDDCSGIEEYGNGTQLILYPNPSSDKIVIDAEKLRMLPASVIVFDISGRIVNVTYEIKDRSAILSAKQFEDGIYYYRISDKGGKKSATGKFVISK